MGPGADEDTPSLDSEGTTSEEVADTVSDYTSPPDEKATDRISTQAFDEPDTLKPGDERSVPSSNVFARRPTIQQWTLESIRRSLATLTAIRRRRHRLVLGISYLVVFGIGAATHAWFTPSAPVRVRVGQVALSSTPRGARVFINGNPVPVRGGSEPAVTPLGAITHLKYAEEYRIRLEKDGYLPWERVIVMGAELDGTRIDVELIPE